MVASAVFILDAKGKSLISRNYRGDIPMSIIDKFMPLLLEKEEEGEVVAPIVTAKEDGVHFLYVLHNGVYFVAITKKNSNATTIFAFLHRLITVGSRRWACWDGYRRNAQN